jgi:hypothetical protein
MTPCTFVEINLLPLPSAQPLFCPEDGGSSFPHNTGNYSPHYMRHTPDDYTFGMLWEPQISILLLIHFTLFGFLLFGVTSSWYWKYISGDTAKTYDTKSHKPRYMLHRHFGSYGGRKREIRIHNLPVRTFCLNPTPVIEAGNVNDMSKYSPYSLHKHQNTGVKQAIKTSRVKMERW